MPFEFTGERTGVNRSKRRQWSRSRDRRHGPFAGRRRFEHVLCSRRRPKRAEANEVRKRRIETWRSEDDVPDRVHAVGDEMTELKNDVRPLNDALDRFLTFHRIKLSQRHLVPIRRQNRVVPSGFEQRCACISRRQAVCVLDEQRQMLDVAGACRSGEWNNVFSSRAGGWQVADGLSSPRCCGVRCTQAWLGPDWRTGGAADGEKRSDRHERSKRFHDLLL